MDELDRLRQENASLRLSLDEYRRYGRQMQVPELGIEGQLRLKAAKVLVVGAGGLGSPALLYLAGAGIGTLGIVDPDTVEVTNLHRQIIHDTTSIGMPKCESAKKRIELINPHVKVITYFEPLTNANSFSIVSQYDLVLDCTDTPATRYLVNDTCVLLGKTLVSGSGLKTEGQLSVLNFNNEGPCYRCFYPTPPPPNTVSSCSDTGVIGPCIGLVGVMMSIEALKVLTGYYTEFTPFLASYSGYGPFQKLRTFKMRGKSSKCLVCSGKLSKSDIETGLDYTEWCGSINYNVLDETERVSPKQIDTSRTLVDVRPKEQFDIVHLPGSVNIPYGEIKSITIDKSTPITVICRYGRDSQLAVQYLKSHGYNDVQDVVGGLDAWKRDVDPDFPIYW